MSRHAIAAAALALFGAAAADYAAAPAFQPVVLPSIAKYGVQTVTAADQVVYLPGCTYETRTNPYSDQVVTTTAPAEGCPTSLGKCEGCNDEVIAGKPLVIVYRYAVEWVEVYEKTVSCPFSEVGPNAFPGFAGYSGYVANQQNSQTGYVKECANGNCCAYQCYWGADGVQHCDDHTVPSGLVPAPPGCEVVSASYPHCFDNHCILAYAYYTVPITPNFPPIYPPGFCHECLLPPGWTTIVTVLPEATTTTTITVPTTVTTTATVTTGTNGATATPSSAALSCPADDRTVFVGNSGTTFLIQCNVGVSGTELNARAIGARALGSTGTFNGCIELCDNIAACEAVSYNPESGECQGFADATTNTNPNGNYVATVITRAATPSSTSSLTSATSTTSASSSDVTSVPTTILTSTAVTSSGVITTSVPTTVVTSTGVTSSTSSTTSADPSGRAAAGDAPGVKRDELVPKRQVNKKAGAAGVVERRAGRIVSPNAEKEKRDNIRL